MDTNEKMALIAELLELEVSDFTRKPSLRSLKSGIRSRLSLTSL